MNSSTHWSKKLRSVNGTVACSEAREWAKKQRSLKTAWANCEDPPWMFWLIGRTDNSEAWSDERKPLVACALECALLAKKYWGKERYKEIASAVKMIQQWTRSKATAEQAQKARSILWIAAYDTAYSAANDAACAAADAVYAAYSAADDDTAGAAAAYATYAAYVFIGSGCKVRLGAGDLAYAYSEDAAAKITKRCVAIIRKHFPNPPKW